MIVTRQRRKPFPWGRIVLPLLAIALVAFAFWWAPSRSVIFNPKMSSFWTSASTVYDRVAAPFHFAEQNKVITALNAQVATLTTQATAQTAQIAADKKKLAAMQSDLNRAQADLAQARSVKPATTAAVSSQSNAASPFSSSSTQRAYGDLASGATPDMRRTAAAWAAMDPDTLAKVLQKLPVPYVARVMALMSSDSAAAILDALPATYAAKLTQENPDLRK